MFAKLLSDGRQPQLLLRPVRGLLQRARARPSSGFRVEGDQVGDDVVVQRRQKRRRRRQGKASELGDSCLKNFGYEIFFIVRPMLQWSNLVTTMSWVRFASTCTSFCLRPSAKDPRNYLSCCSCCSSPFGSFPH